MSLDFNKDFDKKMTMCPLCDGADLKGHKIDYKGVKIEKCSSCDIEMMNPQYTVEYLNRYYSSYVDLNNSAESSNWGDALLEGHDSYLSMIEKYAPNKDSLLSIGSGEGWELQKAIQRGWNVEGYDVDSETTAKLSEKLGIEVKSGDFIELNHKENSYSAVYMHHVLEHPKNPQDYLVKIHKILINKGILFIACPNIDSLANKFKTLMEVIGLKKRKAKHYDTFHHLFYYNPYKLKMLLEKNYGYQVKMIRNGYHVRPGQSKLYRWFLKNLLEVVPYKSTFMLLAKKV